MAKKYTITVMISTKGRYHTTLPVAIMSILQQSLLPDYFMILDDGLHPELDIGSDPLYQHLFKLISHKGMNWEWTFTPQHGLVKNHQLSIEKSNTDLIWRVDDDDAPEPNVLERLVNLIDAPDVGAVASRVLLPGQVPWHRNAATGKIQDILNEPNLQWCDLKEPTEVDHFNNTFLYKRELGIGCPCVELSEVSHREDTLHSWGIRKKGYRLLIDHGSLTWHVRCPTGGIRHYNNTSYWEHDEAIFMRKMKEDGITFKQTKLIVLDNGLGDHWSFKMVLPEIKERHKDKRIVLATCYPEVFEDEKDIEQISIATAKTMDNDLDKYNVYKWAWDHNWKGRLTNAYRSMYL